MSSAEKEWILWVDCEMSGLDPEKEKLIEIGVVLSDYDLKETIPGPSFIIHQSDKVLNAMDEWNTEHHGQSGLTQMVRDSKVSEAQAEQEILKFLRDNNIGKGKCPMAGNSIYMDKIFIMKSMPELTDYLHYRLIDVSTIKELGKRWYPAEAEAAPKKKGKHRAIDDIQDSIDELKYYRLNMFK